MCSPPTTATSRTRTAGATGAHAYDKGEPARQRRDRKNPTHPTTGCAPKSTRSRDLRSSYVTLRIYEGTPLTQIGREVGTSVRMIEQHSAGVIANWDGKQRPAEASIRVAREATIRAARQTSGRGVDALAQLTEPFAS